MSGQRHCGNHKSWEGRGATKCSTWLEDYVFAGQDECGKCCTVHDALSVSASWDCTERRATWEHCASWQHSWLPRHNNQLTAAPQQMTAAPQQSADCKYKDRDLRTIYAKWRKRKKNRRKHVVNRRLMHRVIVWKFTLTVRLIENERRYKLVTCAILLSK